MKNKLFLTAFFLFLVIGCEERNKPTQEVTRTDFSGMATTKCKSINLALKDFEIKERNIEARFVITNPTDERLEFLTSKAMVNLDYNHILRSASPNDETIEPRGTRTVTINYDSRGVGIGNDFNNFLGFSFYDRNEGSYRMCWIELKKDRDGVRIRTREKY